MRPGLLGVSAMAACLALGALGACSGKAAKKQEAAAAEPEKAAVTPAELDKPVEPAAAPSAAGERKTMLRLTLRSTPSGATVAVDGREVGQTPMVHEMEADGQVHQFTFVLSGYSMERYRFPPVRDGVIHATLRPIEQPDAGAK